MVARFVRDEEAAGSNPVIPTILVNAGDTFVSPFLLFSIKRQKDRAALQSRPVCLSIFPFIQRLLRAKSGALGRRIRQLFSTTAKVAVLWMTAAHRGLMRPRAPKSMAEEFTRIVAMKF